nr:MAG TPA: hypothetical protein [Caudoviricetes sp.]
MPNALLIDGRAYPIRTDFRTGIEYQRIAAAGELTAAIFLSLWFPEDQPDNISAALEGVSRFLRRQDSMPEKENSDGPTPYDLTVDSAVISAGFQQKYGIDLTDPETHMHWWRFAALLEGLCGPSFARRVEIRTKDLSGMKAKERAQWMRLRNQYAIRKDAETYKDFIQRLDEIIARGGGQHGNS